MQKRKLSHCIYYETGDLIKKKYDQRIHNSTLRSLEGESPERF